MRFRKCIQDCHRRWDDLRVISLSPRFRFCLGLFPDDAQGDARCGRLVQLVDDREEIDARGAARYAASASRAEVNIVPISVVLQLVVDAVLEPLQTFLTEDMVPRDAREGRELARGPAARSLA